LASKVATFVSNGAAFVSKGATFLSKVVTFTFDVVTFASKVAAFAFGVGTFAFCWMCRASERRATRTAQAGAVTLVLRVVDDQSRLADRLAP
jgi:hypothetical protein